MMEWWQSLKLWFLGLLAGDADFDSLNESEKIDILLQSNIFLLDIIISLLGAIFIAAIVYFFVQRHQQRSIHQTAIRDRLDLVFSLEEKILALHSAPSAFIIEEECYGEPEFEIIEEFGERRELRSILDDTFWSMDNKYVFFQTRRHWSVHERVIWVDSSALHEVLVWFRQVDHASREGIVLSSDLYRVWRQIAPMVCSGRYIYFRSYFGKSDITPILRVTVLLLHFCISRKREHNSPMEHLQGRVDEVFCQDAIKYIKYHKLRSGTLSARKSVDVMRPKGSLTLRQRESWRNVVAHLESLMQKDREQTLSKGGPGSERAR